MDLLMPIASLMETDLVTISPESPMKEFSELFYRRGIHHLIVENNKKEVLGIISSEDVAKANSMIVEEKLLAKHFMTTEVVCLQQDRSIKEVIGHLLRNSFRAFPILDNAKKLVGIISAYDILKELYKE